MCPGFSQSVVGIVANAANGRESNLTGGTMNFTVSLRVYQQQREKNDRDQPHDDDKLEFVTFSHYTFLSII